MINDLSELVMLKFTAERGDYDNCVDISAAGFLPINGDTTINVDFGAHDGINDTLRFFLARVRRQDLPNLIAALEELK